MNIRELILAAEHELNTLKYPDVSEVKDILNKALEAAGIGSLTHDKIESLDIYEGQIHIETSWSARGCLNGSKYCLPIDIFDTEDYVAAAKEWGRQKRIKRLKEEISSLEKNLVRFKEKLVEEENG